MVEERFAWQRQDGETATAFAAFVAFRDGGPVRTLAGAYRLGSGRRQARSASGCWVNWYRRWNWRLRAEAWDAHLEQQLQVQIGRHQQEQAAGLAQQQMDLIREEFQIGQQLLERARGMLAF